MDSKQHDLKPLHVQVSSDLHERLKRMAAARDRSASAETRLALESRIREFEAEEAVAA